jgi:Na+/proline symporter
VIARTPQERLQLLPNPTIASSLTALGIFLTGLLGNIPAQDLQQRIQCARSASTAKWSCILAGCIYIAMGLIPIYLGLAARLHLEEWDTNDRIQSDQVLPILASQFLSEPFGILLVVGLVSLNLAAAGSSTISQTTILSNNVLPRTKRDWGNANGTTKNWLLKNWLAPRREQWCAFAVTVGSLMAAFSGQSVMGLLELSLASVLVSLFVPMCLCLFSNPSTPWSGIVPMLAGPAVWGTKLTWDAWNPSSSESLATNNPDFPAQLSWFAWPNWGQYYGIIPAEIQGLLASVLAMLVAETIARGLRKRSNHVVTPT